MGLKSKRSKITRSRKIDRISSLPDAIISEILSLLSAKCAVRTSILSKRWKYLWTLITNFDFEIPWLYDKPLDGFVDFVDNVLRLCNSTRIQKFRTQCDELDRQIPISRWISEAVRRDVLVLDIKIDKLDLPLNFFTCKTLTVLNLWINSYPEFDIPDSIYFPCLKKLFIHFSYSTNDITEKLFRSCPVLEDLSIHGVLEAEEDIFIDVTAPALKRLDMELDLYNTDVDGHVFLINALKLVYFHLSQLFSVKYMTENLSSLVEASVSVLGPDSYDFGFQNYACSTLLSMVMVYQNFVI